MSDLKSPQAIWMKGFLFLVVGLLSSLLLLLQSPNLRTAALLGLTVWSFCRAYYFAFYVIQHYIDPSYRYSGLYSFVRHAASKSNRKTGS